MLFSRNGQRSDTNLRPNAKYGAGGSGFNGSGGGAGFYTKGADSKFKNGKCFKEGFRGGFVVTDPSLRKIDQYFSLDL
jgi:hypothetical protein